MACLVKFFSVAFLAMAFGLLVADALDAPEACKEDLFCNEKPSYYDSIQQNIDESFEPIQKTLNLNSDNLNEEVEDIVESELNCRRRTRVMKPYTLKTNDTTKVIVQSKFYEQKFMVTECLPHENNLETGDQCFDGFTGLSKAFCKNKYSSISLYIFDDVHKKIERVSVDIPVYS